DRGDHPGPRVGPRHRLGDRQCRHGSTPPRIDGAGQSVGARGQGRGPGPRNFAVRFVSAGEAVPDGHRPGRLESTLVARRDAGHKLLIPYVTGGMDDQWLLTVEALAGSGADAIEV